MSNLVDRPQDEKTNVVADETTSQKSSQIAGGNSNNHSSPNPGLRFSANSTTHSVISQQPKLLGDQALTQAERNELGRLIAENRQLKANNRQLQTSLELRARLIALHKEYEAEIEENLPTIITAAMAELESYQGTPLAPIVPPSPSVETPRPTGSPTVAKPGVEAQREIEAALGRERNRIAQDIHDTLTQQLTGLVLELEASHRSLQANDHERAETQLLKAIKTARSSLADVRNYMFGLRTPWPNQEGLVPALERLITDFHQRNSLPTRLKQAGTPATLPPIVEESLLRITQEALTNVGKHAQAKNVEVILTFEPKEVIIQVIDDGKGFDVEPTLRHAREAGSLGVVGMRERLTGLGGQLELTSTPGQGTRVLVRVPISEPGTQTA